MTKTVLMFWVWVMALALLAGCAPHGDPSREPVRSAALPPLSATAPTGAAGSPLASAPLPTPTATPTLIPTVTFTPSPAPTNTSTSSPVPTDTATPLPAKVQIDGVPVDRQQHNLSCESRSAVDLAAFWGLEIEEDAFLSALPRSDNPYKGFVGNVDAAPGSLPPVGYGVYAEPIAATLRRFGLAAQTRYRLGIEGLRAELAAGRPVLVWATYSLREEPARVWTSADGEVSDIIPWEHTFVAIGYDANGVYLVDPWDQKIQHYTYDAFGASWSRFRQMAVTMQGHLPTCPTCPHRPRRE